MSDEAFNEQLAASATAPRPALEIMYSCKGCGLEKQKLNVRHREEDEPIGVFVEYIARRIATDHTWRSPRCTSQACDLMIPAGNEKGIGF